MSTPADRFTPEALQRMRHAGDPLADAVVACMDRQRPTAMLEEVERRAREEGGPFRAFLDTVNTVPEWVDWDKIEQARRVSLAFTNVRSLALLTGSLVEGYMGGKAVHVLVATGRLQQDVLHRLNETAQMTHNMHQPDGMRPGGTGHRITLEVRLLHAMVRKYLRARGWDTALYDEPINQEDMAFTAIEFDYLAVRGMERLGASLSREDREALHHFWRYAGWLHGVDEFFLTDSVEEEIELYERVCAHQYHPTEESRMMARTVLSAVAGQPPFFLPESFLHALARVCLGQGAADFYDLPQDPRWQPAILALQAANRAATLAHYRLPGFAAASRAANFRWIRRLLQNGLEAEPRKRAFKEIA